MPLSLSTGAVNVWHIDLLVERVTSFRTLLSQDEIERANRFHFFRDQRRFIVARAAMRAILAQYLSSAPTEIVFAYGQRGKPQLSPELSRCGMKFNLSHSRDHALLAVTLHSSIGVDLEYIDNEFASEEIAESFFSPVEIDVLRSIPEEERAAAFFSCWTRKEAYIKAVGDGLAIPLDRFDVSFGPGVPPRLLRVNASPGEASRWSMYNLSAPRGYAAALVVEGHSHGIQQYSWSHSAVL